MSFSDDISGAPDITSGGGDWDNSTATDNPGEPLNINGDTHNVWQKVFITAAGDYVFKHDFTDGADTVMSIYGGPAAAGYADLTLIAQDDDSGAGSKPRIEYTSPGGEWVYIESTGYLGAVVTGQVTSFKPKAVAPAGWFDLNDFSSYMVGWVADMGVYSGPWPILWPPVLNPDVSGGDQVSFLVILPNPSDPTDVHLVADGSYDTYIYRTDLAPSGTWFDGGWSKDQRGSVGLAPLPPVLESGAHLYVIIHEPDSDSVPSMDPASLVPISYGGTYPQEWSPGGWSSPEPASTEAGTTNPIGGHRFGYVSSTDRTGVLLEDEHVTGYTNSLSWAASSGLTYAPSGFPSTDLSLEGANLDADVAAAIPTTGAGTTGSFLKITAYRHYYDPGAGLGIKAVDSGIFGGGGDGPVARAQIGQHHQAREVGVSPTGIPAFFNSGYGTVWVNQPWSFDVWQHTDDPYCLFDAWIAAALFAAGYASAVGVPPLTNPPDQVIDFYGRQITDPLTSDRVDTGGRIEDLTDYVLLASITVSFDWGTGAATFPSTVDLDLSAIPQSPSGLNIGVEIMAQPRALIGGGIAVINTPEIDETTVPNGGEIIQSAEYDFDCEMANGNFPYTVYWPAFSYWTPGELTASGVKWHTVGGHFATVGGATPQILTPVGGGPSWIDEVDGPA